MQHTFSEDERNVIAILQFSSDGQMSTKEVEIILPKKITKYITSLDQFKQLDAKNVKQNELDKVRLIVYCKQNEFKNIKRTKHYKSFIKENIKVSFQTRMDNFLLEKKIMNQQGKNVFTKILKNLLMNDERSVYKLYKNKYHDLLS